MIALFPLVIWEHGQTVSHSPRHALRGASLCSHQFPWPWVSPPPLPSLPLRLPPDLPRISIICDEVNMYFPPIYYVHIFCLVREYSTAVVHESQNVLAFSVLTHLVISPRSCKYTHWNKFQNQPCPFIPFLIKNNYL